MNTKVTPDGLCSACAQLQQSDLLTKGRSFAIGNIKEIVKRARKCSFCRLCLHVIGSVEDNHISRVTLETEFHLAVNETWTCFWHERQSVTGQFEGVMRGGIDGVPHDFTGHDTPRLCLKTRDHISFGKQIAMVVDPSWPHAKRQFYERPLEPDQVDFGLLREWRRLCKQVHQERCCRPRWLHIQQPERLRVIDVHQRTVVDAPESCQYTALSYVWGASSGQFLMKECDLPNSRNEQFKLPQLPQTIEHAMRVTAELGIPFMWVDAVCIAEIPRVNDDKTRHLKQMGRIFKCAEVVIAAAASENASDGIPGVKQARDVHHVRSRVAGLTLALTQPGASKDEHLFTAWNSRAWTYQELLLARRALVFGSRQVSWLCQCDEWHENATHRPMKSGAQNFITKVPARCFDLVVYDLYDTKIEQESSVLSAYLRLVSEYTARRMTHPDDGVNAIAGLLELLARFDSEFWSVMHYGIPEAYFDVFLLWVPNTTCERPTHWIEPHKIPSWSWAGWFSDKGFGFRWEFSTISFIGGGSIPIEIVTSLVWYTVDNQGHSVPMRRHPKRESEWRNRETRRPAGIDPSRLNDIPPRVSADTVGNFNGCLQVLTTTMSFQLGKKLPGYNGFFELGPRREAYALTTLSGKFAGTMILSEDMAAPLLKDNTVLECIFLSYAQGFDLWTGMADKKVKQDSAKDLPPGMFDGVFEKDKWSVLNVMWIGRDESGVAERKMVGKIIEGVWLSEEPKTEWILLA